MVVSRQIPSRQHLPHGIPSWVPMGACYFITICATPKGRNQLTVPTVARGIAESFMFNANRRVWWLELLLIMPDHLHALMKFPPEPGIGKAISDCKHYLARTQDIEWQRDFFEHRLRNDENRMAKAHYIRMNPVRSGLVCAPEEWPFVWTFGSTGECSNPRPGRIARGVGS